MFWADDRDLVIVIGDVVCTGAVEGQVFDDALRGMLPEVHRNVVRSDGVLNFADRRMWPPLLLKPFVSSYKKFTALTSVDFVQRVT